jgi:hypothetical protein
MHCMQWHPTGQFDWSPAILYSYHNLAYQYNMGIADHSNVWCKAKLSLVTKFVFWKDRNMTFEVENLTAEVRNFFWSQMSWRHSRVDFLKLWRRQHTFNSFVNPRPAFARITFEKRLLKKKTPERTWLQKVAHKLTSVEERGWAEWQCNGSISSEAISYNMKVYLLKNKTEK